MADSDKLPTNKSCPTPQPLVWRGLTWPLTMFCITGVLCIPVGLWFGRMGVEKLLTALVLPVGFFWLVMTTWMTLAWIQKRYNRVFATAGWLALTAVSTGPLPNLWVNYLERQIPPYDPQQNEPLDHLVVLGGGTRSGPTRAEAAVSGDRVVYAAQLFIQGHCKQLITTGSSGPQLGNQSRKGPTEETIEIWTGLGVDRSAISTLSGRNTYEEMQSLRKIIPQLEGRRIGILTSAMHLPRAMRLAKAAGIPDLIPVPANYNGGELHFSLGHYLPVAQHLHKFAACQHEWMGGLLGR